MAMVSYRPSGFLCISKPYLCCSLWEVEGETMEALGVILAAFIVLYKIYETIGLIISALFITLVSLICWPERGKRERCNHNKPGGKK